MPPFDAGRWLTTAVGLVHEAGRLLLAGRKGPLAIDLKGEIDLVTQVDRQSEAFLTERLTASFTGTRVLAEEDSRTQTAGADGLWILDPLDGTTNYAHGYPVFAVSLALERAGVLELGIVHDPLRAETFTAIRGGGARLNGARLSVSRGARLGDALLATGFPYDIRTAPRTNLPQFAAMAVRARGIRRAGAAALDLAYVAAGRLDGYWEEKLSAWDVAAGALLVEEAGGRVTGYRGEVPDIRSGKIVASNGVIHDQILAVLGPLEA